MSTRNWLFHPVIATAIGINAFVLAVSVASSGDAAQLSYLLIEDRLVEWMQFLSFAAIAGMLGFAAVDRARRDKKIGLAVLGMAGVSLVVALAALEEISWFQRVLHVESSEFFRQNNRQGETNLHNLAVGNASLHKTVLLKLIFLIGITHNIILPLVARFRPKVRSFVESLGLYLPPLSASIAYLLLVALSHALIDHPRKGELGEMFGAVHYLATVYTAYFVGVQYGGPKVFDSAQDSRRITTLFCMFMVFLVFVSWLLGASSAVVAAS